MQRHMTFWLFLLQKFLFSQSFILFNKWNYCVSCYVFDVYYSIIYHYMFLLWLWSYIITSCDEVMKYFLFVLEHFGARKYRSYCFCYCSRNGRVLQNTYISYTPLVIATYKSPGCRLGRNFERNSSCE